MPDTLIVYLLTTDYLLLTILESFPAELFDQIVRGFGKFLRKFDFDPHEKVSPRYPAVWHALAPDAQSLSVRDARRLVQGLFVVGYRVMGIRPLFCTTLLHNIIAVSVFRVLS